MLGVTGVWAGARGGCAALGALTVTRADWPLPLGVVFPLGGRCPSSGGGGAGGSGMGMHWAFGTPMQPVGCAEALVAPTAAGMAAAASAATARRRGDMTVLHGGSTRRLQREGSAAVSGGPRSRRVGDLGHLAQAPGLDLVDEAAHAVLVREERARLHARDRLAYVGVEVGERLRRPRRADPCVLLDLGFEVVVVEAEHPAPGVVDEDDLLGPQQPLRD